MAARTVVLSDRPPVRIKEKEWPVLASASDEDHEGYIKSQSFWTADWSVHIRQHRDGRALVYATYAYDTRREGERSYGVRHGVLLPAGQADTVALIAAVKAVAARMADAEHHGADGERWKQLADDCIANLPAEDL